MKKADVIAAAAARVAELDAQPSPSCHCDECVSMCHNRPCWPTPAEAKAIIDAGFAEKLMLEEWSGSSEEWREENDPVDWSSKGDRPQIPLLCGAIVGYEGREAPFFPRGTCALLTPDRRCPLHDLGIKPLEGRHAICGDGTPNDVHEVARDSWLAPGAADVIKEWKRIVNYQED